MVAAENFMLVARKEKESIKESLNRSYSETVQKNRDTLCSILDVVILLAKRGIPFRGRWDKSAKRDNGNDLITCRRLQKTHAIYRHKSKTK